MAIDHPVIFTEAPADWPRFDLLTRDRGYVTRCAIPPMNPIPEGLGYGSRVFFKTRKRNAPDDPVAQENPDNYEYIEGLTFWPQYCNQKDDQGNPGRTRFSETSAQIQPADDPTPFAPEPIPETDTALGAPVEGE